MKTNQLTQADVLQALGPWLATLDDATFEKFAKAMGLDPAEIGGEVGRDAPEEVPHPNEFGPGPSARAARRRTSAVDGFGSAFNKNTPPTAGYLPDGLKEAFPAVAAVLLGAGWKVRPSGSGNPWNKDAGTIEKRPGLKGAELEQLQRGLGTFQASAREPYTNDRGEFVIPTVTPTEHRRIMAAREARELRGGR